LRGPVYKKKNLTKKINIDVHALSCKSNGKKKKDSTRSWKNIFGCFHPCM